MTLLFCRPGKAASFRSSSSGLGPLLRQTSFCLYGGRSGLCSWMSFFSSSTVKSYVKRKWIHWGIKFLSLWSSIITNVRNVVRLMSAEMHAYIHYVRIYNTCSYRTNLRVTHRSSCNSPRQIHHVQLPAQLCVFRIQSGHYSVMSAHLLRSKCDQPH